MFFKIFFILCSLTTSINASSIYDQRQNGDLNVQVDLKDVQIIGLIKNGKEEYVDYDYAYDYSEMTIKPQNGTSPKPLNVSSTTVADVNKDNTTIGTTTYVEATTEVIRNITEQSVNMNATDYSSALESTTANGTTDIDPTIKPSPITEISAVSLPSTTNSTHCKKGFIPNQKGGCEFKFQSASNALLKIIKLSQKLKRRESRGED